jgi:hypothetical protein
MSQFMDMIRLPNYGLGVAKGQFQDISTVHQIGAVPAMSHNATGTVWDVNDTIYPWSSWVTAGTLSIPAVNASDDGKTVTIVGLDENYVYQTESVTVSSSTFTPTTNSFIRIERAYISVVNVGNINIQKSDVTIARISAGNGITSMGIYTVPAGYTGYLVKGTASVQDGADATGNMFVRYFGGDFQLGHSFEVSGKGGQYMYNFDIPIKIPAKSDIDVRALVRSNNARFTAAFDLVLDND